MIGAARQDNPVFSALLQIVEDAFSLRIDGLPDGGEFLPCFGSGRADFPRRNLFKEADQLAGYRILVREGDEGAEEFHLLFPQVLHIVFDIHRVGSNDGAVIMIAGIPEFLPLIRDAGIEDGFNPLVDQPFDVPVGNLGRIAFRLGGNGLDPEFIELMGRGRGQDDPVAELCEERMPERIQFIHIQHARNPDYAAVRFVLRERLAPEDQFVLKIVKVGQVVRIALLSDAALAAVAADELAAAGEAVDGKTAVVGTALALGVVSRVLQGIDLLDGEHAGLRLTFLGIALPRDQAGPEGSHDSGYIRPDGLAACDLLESAQNAVIVESTALYDDMFSKFRRVRDFYDFIKGILDHGIGKARGDVLHCRAFLLGLLYFGVHEHRAAGTQIKGMLREQRRFCKVPDRIVQGFREGFYEGTAAGGAGFVQLYGIHRVVADLDAFHILAADIQDAVDLRIKERGGVIMRDRFDLALVQHQSRLHKRLPVAGGAGVDDPGAVRHQGIDLLNR